MQNCWNYAGFLTQTILRFFVRLEVLVLSLTNESLGTENLFRLKGL